MLVTSCFLVCFLRAAWCSHWNLFLRLIRQMWNVCAAVDYSDFDFYCPIVHGKTFDTRVRMKWFYSFCLCGNLLYGQSMLHLLRTNASTQCISQLIPFSDEKMQLYAL